MLLHVAYTANVLHAKVFLVSTERGYAEIFQYTKMMLAALIMLYLYIRTKASLRLMLGLLFVYFFIDDSVGIHERTDTWLSPLIQMPHISWLLPADVWQVATGITLGMIALLAIGYCYKRCQIAGLKRRARLAVICILALGIFAVFVDALHATFRDVGWLDPILALIEDGGEMIAVTGALTVFFDDLIGQWYPSGANQRSVIVH